MPKALRNLFKFERFVWRFRFRLEHLVVIVRDLHRRQVPAKIVQNPVTPTSAQFLSLIVIIKQIRNSIFKRCGIGGRLQDSRVSYHLRQGATITGYHSNGAGHGFPCGEAESLI